MRWLPALLLCGFLAMVSAVASQSPPSLAMQATPPSEAARAFCPVAGTPTPVTEEIPIGEDWILMPFDRNAGVAPVLDIENPSTNEEEESDNGTLNLTTVFLPAHKCILGSYFYPSAVITVVSGQINILIEHWPGVAAAPEASYYTNGVGMPHDLPLDGSVAVDADDWVTIRNESFVGFANRSDAPAIFVVAGLKPDGPPGGGGCGGNCRGSP